MEAYQSCSKTDLIEFILLLGVYNRQDIKLCRTVTFGLEAELV